MNTIRNIWENPEIQGINRLPMRSPLIPFENEKKAMEETAAGPEGFQISSSHYFNSLDGMWDFAFFDSPEKFPDEKTKWDSIKVPLSWTMQGYGTPHYTNIRMPFDCVPPSVPKINPTGYYRLSTKLPKSWSGRRVVLHIGSAESVLILYVNGKEAGVSKDTRLPCEFEINEFLTKKQIEGESSFEIIIKVVRWSDASYVEDQDQWWFGGIHRSVYLYSTENVFIADAKALTKVEFRGTKADGIIPLEVSLGYSEFTGKIVKARQSEIDRKKFFIKYKVTKLEYEDKSIENHNSIGKAGATISEGSIECSLDVRNTLCRACEKITIKNALLWSHETPELYIVTVSLYEGKRHIESSAFTIGFKTVEIKDRKLLLNKKKIYIHGVNRHEHSESNAKTLTTEEMVRDLKILKNYNFNAVRTCHYPDDERWYELCNRYGIWILDEANLENHGYYDVMSRSEEWLNSYIQRVQRMVIRDKNNACIFGWSLGNESGNGPNHSATANWIRSYDETRIVHYEGFVRPLIHQGDFTLESLGYGKGLTDLIGPMYPTIELITAYAKTQKDYRPIIMCEYSHAMGNANGSLYDYWKTIESTPGLQGGFIWDWVDQGIAAYTESGEKYWKYGGDFGDNPSDYDFCLNGINFPDMSPKPAMEECKRIFAPARFTLKNRESGVFEIENKFDFRKLNSLSMVLKIFINGIQVWSSKRKMESLLPDEKMEIQISEVLEYLETILPADSLHINAQFLWTKDTLFAKKGDLCSEDQIELQKGKGFLSAFPVEKLDPQIEFIAATAEPQIFHALTENECVKNLKHKVNDIPTPWDFANKPTKEWLNTGLDGAKAYKIENGIFQIEGKQKNEKIVFGKAFIKTKKLSDHIELSIRMDLTKAVSEYPRAGIKFEIPFDFTEISWFGKGPHENYSDRNFSALKEYFTKNIGDMGVDYIVPQENGLRTETRYLELESDERTIHISADNEFSFSILPYTPEELFRCHHTCDLKKSNCWHLNIDMAHRGVGTGACGPDTRNEYKVKPKTYKLKLKIW